MRKRMLDSSGWSEQRASSPSVDFHVTALILILALLAGCGSKSSSDSSSSALPNTGKAGSQARFALAGNYLYAIDGPDLQMFDVTVASNPSPWTRQFIGFNIETLFAYNQYLFVGSQNGVFIFDNTNPQFPAKTSSLLHARSCDPVVVEGNYAYVTLRNNNTRCGGTSNQLDVIDLSVIANPVLVKSYAMQQPAGLGVVNGRVFLCDGSAGLKVFDVADPLNIVLADRIVDQNCFDVIPNNNVLVVSGSTGLFQYDYASLPMTEMSRLQRTQ